jgi:hypothetical protein
MLRLVSIFRRRPAGAGHSRRVVAAYVELACNAGSMTRRMRSVVEAQRFWASYQKYHVFNTAL